MKELYKFRQFLTEGVIEDEIASRIRKLGKENGIANADIKKYVDELSGSFEPDAYKNTTDAELLDDLKLYMDLAEGKLLKENEEQGYTLFTTNVEYDNGKTGYMYQLVNSEDGEENEIGFDQLYFVGKGDASDPRVFIGKDFKEFDQGSYQEEEVSAEEAMKIYNKLK